MAWTPKRILQGAALICWLSSQMAVAQQTEIPEDLEIDDEEMGPAAFLWPPDRVWSGEMDNTAPCGSRASPGNRTEFPLTGGEAALLAQDDFFNVKIGISFSENPTSNSDFATIMENRGLEDLNPGYTCVPVPDAPAGITAGRNATLQMVYSADFGAPHNQTFYTCADITYVEAANFRTRVPCFNATRPGDDDGDDGEDDDGDGQIDEDDEDIDNHDDEPTGTRGPGSAATRLPDDDDDEPEPKESSQLTRSGGGGSGLSRGEVAGAVAGTISAVILLCAVGLLWYRRDQQKKRRIRLARMEENARAAGHIRGGSTSKEGAIP